MTYMGTFVMPRSEDDSGFDELLEWCDRNLDTSSFEGMYGALGRVQAEVDRLELEVSVYWENRPAYHPTLKRCEGAGTYPCLVIEKKGGEEDRA